VHKVQVYRNEEQTQPWRWRRVADNGKIVSTGAESYFNMYDCADEACKVNALPFILSIERYLSPPIEEVKKLHPVRTLIKQIFKK
jgi:hypothetical protein